MDVFKVLFSVFGKSQVNGGNRVQIKHYSLALKAGK